MLQLIEQYQTRYENIAIPCGVFFHPMLSTLSGEAVFLYGTLLSIQESGIYTDESGNKCVRFTIPDVAELFRCGTDKAKRILHELDAKNGVGLLSTKKYPDGHTISYILFPGDTEEQSTEEAEDDEALFEASPDNDTSET